MRTVSWPKGCCNDRVCWGPVLWFAEGSRGTERAETEGKSRISSLESGDEEREIKST